MNGAGLCPACHEHCEWIDDEEDMNTEDTLEEMRAFGQATAQTLVRHLLDMNAAKATIPVTLDGIKYIVTVERSGIPCSDERMCVGCYTGTGCTNLASQRDDEKSQDGNAP
jgi:hypothetical protein